MITRRNVLRLAGTAAAAGLGVTPALLMHRKPKPPAVRIHTLEIDNWDRVMPFGRKLSWNTIGVKDVPAVGATLQIEKNYEDAEKVERFRVIVTRHEVTL